MVPAQNRPVRNTCGNWETIGLVYLVQDFFKFGSPLLRINKTFIVLIPKKEIHKILLTLEKLAFAMSVTRLFLKWLLIARLREVLERIISHFQSAFVKGGMVTDNYIVAHEVLPSFKKKRRNKVMTLKLDMAKPYDKLE